MAQPKLSKKQAQRLWHSLSEDQKKQFNEMIDKMQKKQLEMVHVGVDDNEQIQHIVLEPKDKPSKPIAPFAKYFDQKGIL